MNIDQRRVYVGMGLCIAMMVAILWMPSMLGALFQAYGLTPRALSYLACGELSGFLLGTLFTSSQTIAGLERWVLAGCATLAGINLIALLFAPRAPLIALLPLSGLGSGLGFGFVLKLCSASAQPTRNFGLLTALMSLAMIVGFQMLAHLAERRGVATVVQIAFGSYAALAMVAALLLATNRLPAIDRIVCTEPHERGALGLPVQISLLAILLSFIGQGALWAFLQTLGISHGFSASGVADAMSLFAIMGIVGSLGAAALPATFARASAIALALIVLWLGLYALYSQGSLALFTGGCAIAGFYWNFALSLMLGLTASVDRTGRGSVLGGTMSSAGAALGPLFAGLLISGSDYKPVGWLVGLLCVAGVICVLLVERRVAH